MIRGNIFSLLPFACLIASCATPNVDSAHRLERAAKTGLLVVSLTQEGVAEHERTTWLYRRMDGTAKDRLLSSNARDALDWSDPVGRLAYIALPAGHYEFYGAGFVRAGPNRVPTWHVDAKGVVIPNHPWYAGLDSVRYSDRDAEPFSIPFDILPGKATYLGNLHFLWSDAEETGKVQRLDRAERDLALLRQRLPELRVEQIKIAPPTTALEPRMARSGIPQGR